MGCCMSKSRHNRLAKKPMLTEIGSNSSLSNALLPSSNRDARSSDRDDGRHDRMERYTAPQASWRHSSGELDSDPAMNPMYETAPGAGPVHTEPSRVDASKGPSVKPGAANSVVRAVKGKTVLNFEHPFKQESFKKRGQMVKNWKRRHFVMDCGEVMYFKDTTLSDKQGSVVLCGAIVNYIDESATTGCAAIEIHGDRDLLMECDSSAVAEEWTAAIYDVVIVEDLAYLRNHFPTAPTCVSNFNCIKDIKRFQKFANLDVGASKLLSMCEMICLQFQAALRVLERGVDCILFGLDAGGKTNIETGFMKLSDDKRAVMWTAVSVLKKQYSRKGSVESGGVAVSGLCNRIPLDSIYDIVIGSLNCGVGESNSAQLSTGSVLSIITATHSLEFELDVSEISTSSCYITDNTLYRINSKSSRDSTVNDMRATTASAFARPSSIFSFNADGGTQGKSPQELASCPQVLSRHPFYKALRMVLLIQGHIRMVNFITTSLLNSGVSTARKATVSTLQTTLETRKRGAGMRPADRARAKILV